MDETADSWATDSWAADNQTTEIESSDRDGYLHPPPDSLRVGSGVRLRGYTMSEDGVSGEIVGVNIWHVRPSGDGWCLSTVPFASKGANDGRGWDVTSTNPLSLSPSVLCRACGRHGWLVDGEWVDA